MFRYDASHSSNAIRNDQTNSTQLLWSFKANRMIQSSPAVANGYVIVCSRDATAYSFKASTGEMVWKHFIGAELWSSPAICNDRVYFGADDCYVYSLNITDGATVWRTQIGGIVRSSPAIVDGFVYIGSGNQGVYALNASDGKVLWSHPTPYRVFSSPAVSNGIVYVGTDDYDLYALNASNGEELWHINTSAGQSSPSVYNDCVYVGSFNGYIYGLNATTGAKIWEYLTGSRVDSSPAVADGRVYVGSQDNYVYCLNAFTGQKIWQSATGFWVTSSPAVANGNVYIGSQDYSIYCFDAATGEKKWSYTTGNIVESSPAIADGVLYIGSDDLKIYALALVNSTSESLSAQSVNSLAWTTVAFDSVASAIAAIAIFTIVHFARSTWRSKRRVEPTDVSVKKRSCFLAHRDAILILAILAFSLAFFVNLGKGSLWAADEQIYSQWAFHMVKSGDYVTPWAYGESCFYIAKPPLTLWLMSVGYQMFGVNNFATRFWNAVLGALTLVVVFYLGKKLYNSYVGLLSALVLGTFSGFYSLATHAMTDVPLVFFAVASIYFYVLSEETEKTKVFAVLSGLFFGLALMTKQFSAFIIPIILFVYLAVTKKNNWFIKTKRFLWFFLVGIAVFLPWVLYMTLRFGPNFLQPYLVESVIARATSSLEGHAGDYWYYFTNLGVRETLPWIILLPFATGICAVKAFGKRSNADTLVIVWMTAVLLIFTIVQTKIYWYIMPAFPAFAFAIGSFLYQLSARIYTRISK